MKKYLLLTVFSVVCIVFTAFSQIAEDGDYRTRSTGALTWSGITTWQVRTGGSWANTTTPPTSANNVYIQASSIVTVDVATVACKDLQLRTTGTLALGDNIIEVNGKIRSYSATAVFTVGADGTFYSGQTNSTSPTATTITSTSIGALKFVGSTRNITNTSEWGSTTTGVHTIFALNADAVGTIVTGFKSASFVFASGTIDMGTNRLAPDNGTTAQGNVTINAGATLIHSGTGSTPVMSRTTTAATGVAGTFTLNGTLRLLGSTPKIEFTTVNINAGSLVEYASASSQTLLSPSYTGAVNIPTYYYLKISNAGSKQVPPFDVTILDSLVNEGIAQMSNTTNSPRTIIMANGSSIVRRSGTTAPTNSAATSLGTSATDSVNVKIGTSCSISNEFVSTPNGPGNYKTLTIESGVTYTITGGRTIANIVNNGFISLSPSTTFTTIVGGTISGTGVFGTDITKPGTASFNFIGSGNVGTLKFDQSSPGLSNALNNFTINRTDGGNINLDGNITINGTLNFTSGNLTSNGNIGYTSNGKLTYSTGGTFTTTSFEWPTVNGPSEVNVFSSTEVILNESKRINGVLTISSGFIDLGNFNLTLSSSARFATTASIAPFIYSGTGLITTETFIPAGRRAYRFLGHPFSTALSMSSLTDDIFVTGDGTTAGTGGVTPGTDFDATTTNAASSFWFDQTTNGWKAFMTAADASWTQYAGTRILVRGDRSQADALTGVAYTPNAVTLDMTGAVNSGNQNIAVSNAGNFHLVSNPYPSPVNIGTVVDATANIGTTYWVWDANAVTRGAYVPLTVGSGAYNLAMNGAFFVQPTVGTTLAFTEANKTASATANLFRTQTAQNQLELQVNYNGGYADLLYVRNNATASTTKEATDGSKLSNPDVNVYAIASGNEQLTLDSRPIVANTIIPVGFTSTIQSNFEIALNSNTLNNGLDVIVKDKFLNVEHTLTASNPYSFAVTADAASQGQNRFELVFRNSSALPTNFVTVSAVQQGNAIAVNFTTANEQNMNSYEVEESANGTTFSKGTSIKANNTTTASYNWLDVNVNTGNNYYRIKAIEKNGVVKYSQVVNVRTGSKGSEFAVYPNPVKGGVVNVQLMNIEKGQYSIKIVNSIGQEVAAKTIVHNGGNATQTLSIGNVTAGTYNMVISNGTTSVTKAVIVE